MASDPFHTFASTVRSSLTAARDLSAQYTSLTASASSTLTSSSLRRPAPSTEDDVLLAHDRLNDALEALKQDVDDVRQSVAVVKRSPERFAVDEAELARREEFLRMCQEEVKSLERVASKGSRSSSTRHGGHTSLDMAKDRRNDADDQDDNEDSNVAFEREHQQMIMSQQDSTLTTIGRTISSLHTQASTLGTELGEQVDLVRALDSEVEQSQTRLGRAMTKMDEMVRRGDDRLGGWCVWILVVALFFLLLIAIII